MDDDTIIQEAPVQESSVKPAPSVARDAAALTEPAAARRATAKPRSLPKWEQEARDSLRAGVRKFTRPLADLQARDANEGDTRLLVTDFLCDVLGYDKYSDLTTEYSVKGEFADYGVRIDQQLVAFIEVKRVTTKLRVSHLRQVQMYAVNEGVEWVILTNGSHWQVFHLTGGLPMVTDLAIDVNLTGDQTAAYKADQLFYLHRDSFKRNQITDVWRAQQATAPSALAQLVLSEPVLGVMRKELRRTSGHTIDEAELSRLMRETLIRPDAMKS